MFVSEYCSTGTVSNAITLTYELQERANQDKFGIAADFSQYKLSLCPTAGKRITAGLSNIGKSMHAVQPPLQFECIVRICYDTDTLELW